MSVSYSETFNNGFAISPYLNAEITNNKFIDFVDNINNYSGNKLTGVPDKKINGGIQFVFKNFSLNTNFIHLGSMPLDDANTLYSKDYTVFNTKLSYKNAISKHLSIEINTGVNNFTDKVYASSILINAVGFGNSEPRYYYPGMPRNWYSCIKIRYII